MENEKRFLLLFFARRHCRISLYNPKEPRNTELRKIPSHTLVERSGSFSRINGSIY